MLSCSLKYFIFQNHSGESKIIWLNDYLDDHNICYIGSNRKALENEYDKCIAKDIMQKSNINTADFFTSYPGEYKNKKSLPKYRVVETRGEAHAMEFVIECRVDGVDSICVGVSSSKRAAEKLAAEKMLSTLT